MNNNFKRYIVFWLSQALSQLGSSMTSFALILWIYTQKETAMTVLLMTFFNYIPYIIVSLFAGTFMNAFLVLILILKIPEDISQKVKKKSVFSGCNEGFQYLKQNNGIFIVIITMALLNFFSRLTYENILSPMILSRSANDSVTLGIVNAVMGIGGIVGGIIVSTGKVRANSVKMIYISAFVSFLLGDIMMGIGRNVIVWSIAGLAASLPIPFINAGQMVILYQNIPEEIQGRIFAVRNAIQFSSIPLGILLGGFLADYVFEPFMFKKNAVTLCLRMLVGEGAGSGMAVMFLCTGILGALFSFIFYQRKDIRNL